MSWQITTLLFVLLSSVRTIQNRRVGLYKKDLSLYALVASFTCIFAVGMITAVINWSEVDSSAAIKAWPFLVVGGILFASINVILLKLFRYIPASVMAFTTLLNTLSVLLFATLAGGESISARQIYGAILLFGSVIIVGLLAKSPKKSQKNIIIGISIAIFIALLFGPAIMNEKYLIGRIGFNTYLLYGWGLQALSAFTMAFILKIRKRNKTKEALPIKTHVNVWLVGVLLGFSGLTYVTSLNKSGSASTIVLSGTAAIAVTVFLAYFILQEKEHLRPKIIGLLLIGFGLLLLIS